jgi:hypothetical protein
MVPCATFKGFVELISFAFKLVCIILINFDCIFFTFLHIFARDRAVDLFSVLTTNGIFFFHKPPPRFFINKVLCFKKVLFQFCTQGCWSQDSSVGIASRYGLDGLGIESRWGRGFPRTSLSALRPTRPPME